jgi:hypothetical protein
VQINSEIHKNIFFYFTLDPLNEGTHPTYRRSTKICPPFEKFALIVDDLIYPPEGFAGVPDNSEKNIEFLEELAFSLGFVSSNMRVGISNEKQTFVYSGDVDMMEKKTCYNRRSFALGQGTTGMISSLLEGKEHSLFSFDSKNVSGAFVDATFDVSREILPQCLFGFNVQRIELLTGRKMTEFKFTFSKTQKILQMENKLKITVLTKY